jgi:hypothetical protein
MTESRLKMPKNRQKLNANCSVPLEIVPDSHSKARSANQGKSPTYSKFWADGGIPKKDWTKKIESETDSQESK